MSLASSNARVGIAELESPLIRRKSDGFTLLHVFAGGVDCHDLLAFLIRAGIHPDTTVSLPFSLSPPDTPLVRH
jgi:hypothetical protein